MIIVILYNSKPLCLCCFTSVTFIMWQFITLLVYSLVLERNEEGVWHIDGGRQRTLQGGRLILGMLLYIKV